MCEGCGNEFEFLEADCTHPYVSFSPPIGESSKGKGKTKGTSKGANGNGTKGNGKGAYEYNGGEYKGKSKGKGRGDTGDIDIMAILKQYGSGIISEQQADLIKNAMKISPMAPKPKTPLQDAKAEYKAAFAASNISKKTRTNRKRAFLLSIERSKRC